MSRVDIFATSASLLKQACHISRIDKGLFEAFEDFRHVELFFFGVQKGLVWIMLFPILSLLHLLLSLLQSDLLF